MNPKWFRKAKANGGNAAYTQGHKWQRRFWAHLLRDQGDFNNHVDYIHLNPVKQGWVQRVADWPHSSFHRYVEMGVYPINWGLSGDFTINASE